MPDKQLTVAELLARAKQENPQNADAPSRRRRRSLDEGGVSVAELTGSLKAVDARPAEVKHSSVPIDDEQPAAAPVTAPEAPQPEVKEPEFSKPEVSKPEVKRPEFKKPDVAPHKAETPEVSRPEAKKPEADAAETGTIKLRKFSADKLASPKPEEPKPAEPTPAAPAAKAMEETAPVPVVTDRPRPSLNEPARPEPTADAKPKAPEFEKPVPAADAERRPEPVYEDVEAYEEETEESVNPISLVLMIFAGLVIGVLVFFAFQYLWETQPVWLVSVLGVLVTAGVVVGVRSMKAGRDTLTQVIAGLAGLAMTFGPAAVTVL